MYEQIINLLNQFKEDGNISQEDFEQLARELNDIFLSKLSIVKDNLS